MLGPTPNLAGNRTGVADRLDEMHPVASPEQVEAVVRDAIAVTIKLRAGMGQDEAVISIRKILGGLALEQRVV
jgi:hypothetical protein